VTDHRIATSTGQLIDPFEPDPEQIQIEDIAHGLAGVFRYAAQCPTRYTVAQHSLHVAKMMMADKQPGAIVVAGLMHDAAEAYIGDVVRPIRPTLHYFDPEGDKVLQRAELEHAWQTAIHRKFAIPEIDHATADTIARYDRCALMTEIRDLWADTIDLATWPDYDSADAWPDPIERVYAPDFAAMHFLNHFAARIVLAGETTSPTPEPKP